MFDVSTPEYDKGTGEYRRWDKYEQGFYAAEPHVVFENRFNYPESDAFLTQYIVAMESGMKVFRIYHTHYTKDSITRLLRENGFKVLDIYEDLCGVPYDGDSPGMGIISSAAE